MKQRFEKLLFVFLSVVSVISCTVIFACAENLNEFTTEPIIISKEYSFEDEFGECIDCQFTVLLTEDGSVWTWGNNTYGQLGDGTTTDRYTPLQIKSLHKIKSILVADSSVYAVKNDGTVWAWGNNDSGQLGDGTYVSKTSPVQLKELSDVDSITYTSYDDARRRTFYTLYALKNNGTVFAWGDNNDGQLGCDKSKILCTDSPIKIDNLEDVKHITTMGTSVFATKSDNTLWSWGYNKGGQLGIGTTTNISTPTQVMGDVKSISVLGYSSIFVIKNDGTVWAWGGNSAGQLGDGTTTVRYTPTQVKKLQEICSIETNVMYWASYGYYYTVYALSNDGAVWAWGDNEYGQLGCGNYKVSNSITPLKITDLDNVKSITTDNGIAYAITNNGELWSWGYGNLSPFSPVQVESSDVKSVIVSTGYEYSDYYVVKTDNTLGYTYKTTPSKYNYFRTVSADVQYAMFHDGSMFAIKYDGAVLAWGNNDKGQLGIGTTSDQEHVTTLDTGYTVSYNGNEGTNVPPKQLKYNNKDLILSDMIPTRNGYVFRGWAIEPNGDVVYLPGDVYTINEKITLYAVWHLKDNTYIIKYDANGGTDAPAEQIKYKNENINLTTSYPTLFNYKFTGWSTSAQGDVEYQSGSIYKENSNITLYAVWKPLCKSCDGKKYFECRYCNGTSTGATKRTCSVCNGNGALPEKVTVDCNKCLGLGVLEYIANQGWVYCYNCNRTGKVSTTIQKDCSKCVGGIETIPPSCSECLGYKKEKCTTCNGTGFCKAHKYDKSKITKPATCTDIGETLYTCSVCGDSKTETIPANGHKEATDHAVSATCKNNGLTQGSHCSVCDTVIVTQKQLPKKAHTYNSGIVTKKATYSESGIKTYTCTYCGNEKGETTTKLTLGKTSKIDVSQAATSVTLKWNAVKNATGYRIFRKVDGKWKTVKTISSTSFEVTGLSTGTKYIFAVRAYVKENGKTIWAPSYTTISTVTKPTPPSKVKASKCATNYITLSWSKCTGATGYRIYRYVDGKWKTLKTTTATSYKVTGLSAGKKYIFAVKPYIKTESGNVWASSYTKLTTATKPATPTLKVSSTSTGKVALVWSNVSGESGYQAYYSTNKSSGYKKLSNYKANTVKASKSKLTSGKTYYFKVRAYKKVGNKYIYSSWSSVKSIKIK